MFLLDYALKVGQKRFKILNICYIYIEAFVKLSARTWMFRKYGNTSTQAERTFFYHPESFEVSLKESLKDEKCLGWILRKLLDYLGR